MILHRFARRTSFRAHVGGPTSSRARRPQTCSRGPPPEPERLHRPPAGTPRVLQDALGVVARGGGVELAARLGPRGLPVSAFSDPSHPVTSWGWRSSFSLIGFELSEFARNMTEFSPDSSKLCRLRSPTSTKFRATSNTVSNKVPAHDQDWVEFDRSLAELFQNPFALPAMRQISGRTPIRSGLPRDPLCPEFDHAWAGFEHMGRASTNLSKTQQRSRTQRWADPFQHSPRIRAEIVDRI